MNITRTIKSVIIACVFLGTVANADELRVSKSPLELSTPATASTKIATTVDFESSWAPIATYISVHAVSMSSDAVTRLHDETKLGQKNILVDNSSIGWPAAFNSTITFDSPASAMVVKNSTATLADAVIID